MSRKTEKKLKMRKTHCRTWNMEKKPENGEHETQTLFDLEYGEKNLKMRYTRCNIWNMERKLTHEENETHTL